MVDFTSVLYLGLWHPAGALRPWTRLTTGAPAALVAPPGSARVAGAVAELVGTERALVGTSTLHLFWDLFGILRRREVRVLVDDGAYPVVRWGAERVAARARPVRAFRHFDVEALGRALHPSGGGRRLPVVVCDGYCPGCGRVAPLAGYLEAVRRHGGLLVVDDTQALGIFGAAPDAQHPCGRGGGGAARWTGARGTELLLVSSLAKAFGAPLAVMAGSTEWMEVVEKESEVRVHCSPPSAAALAAAAHALTVNRRAGELLRGRLRDRVAWLQARLAEIGVGTRGDAAPVQPLELGAGVDPVAVRDQLLHQGVRTVVLAPRCGERRLVLLVTARHRREDIDFAVRALTACLGPARPRLRRAS